MDSKFEKVQKILTKYHQEHLIKFYFELSQEQKNILLDQILDIDFENILNLYDNSMKEEKFLLSEISPLNHFEDRDFSKKDIEFFSKIGEEKIKNNAYAVVTMAGGQGTRLGYKGPKGTYELDLEPKKKSLFQIICEDIKRANDKFNVTIPWYIMTSLENDGQTKDYFIKHDFFRISKRKNKIFYPRETSTY